MTEKKEITIKDLLEAGVQWGHVTSRRDPKMEKYIYEARNGVSIIDLAKTLQQIRNAVQVIKEAVAAHKSILFVGTKKQAKEIIMQAAESCGEFFVCERWLGGMLTNLPTIRQSIKKLERIEKRVTSGGDGLTKKELTELTKLQTKLEKNLSGIRSMRKPPGLVVVVDPNREHIAVAEAKKLGIPVMALVDTNCNPDPIDYVIACNDDAFKSVRLIIFAIAEAISEKKAELKISSGKKGDEEESEDGKAGAGDKEEV